MNIKKIGIIGTGLFVVGSLAMAASSAPQKASLAAGIKPVKVVARPLTPAPVAESTVVESAVVPESAPAPAQIQQAKLELVVPPEDLPKAKSEAMVSSIAGVAPAKTVSVKPEPKEKEEPKAAKVAKVSKAVQTAQVVEKEKVSILPSMAKLQKKVRDLFPKEKEKVKPLSAKAPANKKGMLFSYSRLLNFSPHPQDEEFLKDQPLVLNGKNYHISVGYKESWNVISDEEGQLKKIGFEIKLYQNGTEIRKLQLPAMALNPANLKKGQVLGLAEVAPYKFKIAVENFTVKQAGITELVFKFDMTS